MVAANISGELSFTMENYILPASQPNVGATYKNYKDNPLQVNVLNQTYDCKPYEVEINALVTAQVDEEVSFDASVGKGLKPFSYEWEFGDGSSSSENPGIHIFDDCADYTVNLYVSNTCGSAQAPHHTIKIEGCQQPTPTTTPTLDQYYLPLVNYTSP
jgi:PKD repeat protein